jgi:hypothetical protein
MAKGRLDGTCYHPDGYATDIYQFYVEYETGTPSIDGNYTPLTVALKLQRHNNYHDSAYNLIGEIKVRLSIDGVEVYSTNTAKADTRNGLVCTFTTQTKNVSHNDDGTKTVPISASFSNFSVSSLSRGSLSGNIELEDIARASVPTVSASSVKMGNSVTINTNRKASSFTHALTYSFGGVTGTIATGVGISYKWTVPDLVAKIPNEASGVCTITCKTYSGTLLVGTKTVDLTLLLPNESEPSVSASTVKMGTSVVIYTNSGSESFTHTLTYAIGEATGTIGTGVEDRITWTPSKDLAAYAGSQTSATCTVTCATYNGSILVGTATTQIDLIVPGATGLWLSASSVDIGSNITIYLASEADVYTHNITYALKEYGGDEVIATGDIISNHTGDYVWRVPTTLEAEIPSDTKATITVICETWNGTSLIGTKTASFTVTVPDNSDTRPQVTMSVSPVDSPFEGVYVAGMSKVKVSYQASSANSTIASYETTIFNTQSNKNPYISETLANAGTVTIEGKVTDARGYYTEVAKSITVVDYSRPRIVPYGSNSRIVCMRCNRNGNADPGGSYLRIELGRKYSKVVSGGQQHNYCKITYEWKEDAEGDSAYSNPEELLSRGDTSDYITTTISGIVTSNTTAYNIRLTAEDDLGGTDTVVITVPTAFVTFHVPDGGHGFTLGGYHDGGNYDAFVCWFDAEFHGDVSGIYTQGETDGWYWRKFNDGVAECWLREEQTVDISNALSTMYVGSCDAVAFPFTFDEVPAVSVTVESETPLLLITSAANTTSGMPAPPHVAQFAPATVDLTISYHAIGRWK